jgi:hypothetical protein
MARNWNENCEQKATKGPAGRSIASLPTLEAAGFPSRKRSAASAPRQAVSIQPHPLLTLSAQQTTWLFFRRAEELKAEEQESFRQLRQASPQLEATYQLVEAFLHMIRRRTGEPLDAWLAKVEASHLEAFEPFVTSIQKDKDALCAGLTLPWSNAPLEGQVNRLKLIKRSRYGRAKFDLLKIRVLHHSKKSLERKNKAKKAQQEPHLKTSRVRTKHINFQNTTWRISEGA